MKNTKSLNKFIIGGLISTMLNIAMIQTAHADEETTITQIQGKYGLTEAEVKSLQDSSISNSQMNKVARLAEASGKSVDEVLKMRTEQKMGWGKIAKELGVDPKELGQSVAEAKHEMKEEQKQERAERKAERKMEGKNRHAAMKEKRSENKKDK